jgi:hypothetical protein
MRRPELTWFRLRFPHDLSDKAVLAALSAFSGVSYNVRLVFDLSASSDGIEHRLATSPAAADIVTATLRAAIPSLRLDTIEAPAHSYSRRLIWQLAPATSPIRIEDSAAITASLLSSLFPLKRGEAIHLSWTLRPSVRPALPLPPDLKRDGYLQAMRPKLALPGLSGYGQLMVTASNRDRANQLLRRPTAVLRSLSTPYGRLVAEPYWYGLALWLIAQRGHYFSVAELAAIIGWPIDGPDLPGLELGAAKRLVPSSSLPTNGRILGTSDFAGVQRPVAITAMPRPAGYMSSAQSALARARSSRTWCVTTYSRAGAWRSSRPMAT